MSARRRLATATAFLLMLLAGLGSAGSARAASAAQLNGTLTDRSGAIVAGATVQALVAGSITVVASTTSDVAGHYSLTVDAGSYDLIFQGPASTPGIGAHLLGLAISGVITRDVTLGPATATLSGTVRDRFGNPAAYARLSVDGIGISADVNGAFSRVVPTGTHVLYASYGVAEGSESLRTNPFDLTGDLVVNLGLSGASNTVTVHLAKSDGSAVAASAYLSCDVAGGQSLGSGLTLDHASVSYGTATADETGTVVFTSIPASAPGGCTVGVTGSTLPFPQTTLTVDGDEDLTVTAPEVFTVSGVIHDRFGNPAAHARVGLYGSRGATETFSDENGSFQLLVQPGRSALAYRSDSESFATLPFDVTGDLTLDLGLVGTVDNTVTVHLRTPDGSPATAGTGSMYCYLPANLSIGSGLTAVSTSIFADFNEVDASGSMAFHTPLSGPDGCRLDNISIGGIALPRRSFSVTGDTEITVMSPQLATVSGVIKDRLGNPATSAYVSLQGAGSGSIRTDQSGAFSITVPVGRYTLSYATPSGSPEYVAAQPIDLTGDLSVNLSLQSVSTTRLTVHLANLDGTPTGGSILLTCSTTPGLALGSGLMTAGSSVGQLSASANAAGVATLTVPPSTPNGCTLFTMVNGFTLPYRTLTLSADTEFTYVGNQGLVLPGGPTTSSDDDNVSNLVEAQAPNGGDGNSDGVPDYQQANVTSLPTFGVATGPANTYVTLAAPSGTTLQNVATIDPTNTAVVPTPPPDGVSLPEGLTKFVLTGVTAGTSQTISIYTASTVGVNGYAKLDPRTNTWSLLPSSQVAIYPDHVDVTLVDGGAGDADGSANGSIDDPGGLAVIHTPQTLTWTAPPPASMTYGASVPVAATSSAGLPVTITASGACTTTGTTSPVTLKATSTGSCTVTADQPGGGWYTAATSLTATAAVGKAPLTVTPASAAVQYSDPLPALTTATYSPFVNGDTAAALTGTLACSASVSTASARVTSPAGSYPISCTGLSAVNYAISYAPAALTVTAEDATLTYTGPQTVTAATSSATSATVGLQAQLTQAADGSAGDLTTVKVLFDVYGSANATATPDRTFSATPNAAGLASASAVLAIDVYRVVVRLDPTGAGYYTAPTAPPATVTVITPAGSARAFGSGKVKDPSFSNLPVAVSTAYPQGSFAFSVKYASGKTPKGSLAYTFRGADGYDYLIISTGWAGGSATFSATTSSFTGQASVVVTNPKTGRIVAKLGGTGYTFRADVTDKTPDTFALSVTKAGRIYHQVGTPTAQLPLTSGNLSVSNK